MESKLNIDDYKALLEKEEYEQVYFDIRDKAIKLAKKIAKTKNIKLDFRFNKNIDDRLYTIRFTFEKESATFREMSWLMKNLLEWYTEDIYEDELLALNVESEFGIEIPDEPPRLVPIETKEEKIRTMIRQYNWLVSDLEEYNLIANEIKEHGYEKLIKQKKEKLLQIFKEMLDYKNKKYDNNWTLREFADKISQYYNYYSDSLPNAISAVNMGFVEFDIEENVMRIDEIESLIIVNDFIEELTCEGDDYKRYANYYRDFELEEGQEFRDLYNQELEKFKKLFKDMLDFRNIEYDKNEDRFDILKDLVMKYYPYYYGMLFHLISPRPNVTYIQELSSMEDVYERMSGEYKNHEENLIKYKEYMEILKKEGYPLEDY